ncbi:putative Kinesin-II 95 kDa subunit [Paratrimastix pyriformis]|uniref:Kinesin-II 95 kDa subunit n=1 Tax=Paratrimastix pyriformis TaxID=342808 RepID=A0ABQ8UVK7_9EUKA|nr:putative Kinesin-II 95 kDa subunit [Paratrimastix pyriformis]
MKCTTGFLRLLRRQEFEPAVRFMKPTNVKFVVRVAPLPENTSSSIGVLDDHQTIIYSPDWGAERQWNSRFVFDKVATPTLGQRAFYYQYCRPLVALFAQRTNGVILAYGPAQSGKTLLTEGYPGDHNLAGCIPRIAGDVLRFIDQQRCTAGVQLGLWVSFLQFVNEHTYIDLLASSTTGPHPSLKIGEDRWRGSHVVGCSSVRVINPDEVTEFIQRALPARTHRTRNNIVHTIFTFELTELAQNGQPLPGRTSSKLSVVELAAPEVPPSRPKLTQHPTKPHLPNSTPHLPPPPLRQLGPDASPGGSLHSPGCPSTPGDGFGTPGAAPANTAGKRNLCYNALACVFSALFSGPRPGHGHVPYRNSKLTHYLKESLSLSSAILFALTLNPSIQFHQETLQALRYADRVRRSVFQPAGGGPVYSSPATPVSLPPGTATPAGAVTPGGSASQPRIPATGLPADLNLVFPLATAAPAPSAPALIVAPSPARPALAGGSGFTPGPNDLSLFSTPASSTPLVAITTPAAEITPLGLSSRPPSPSRSASPQRRLLFPPAPPAEPPQGPLLSFEAQARAQAVQQAEHAAQSERLVRQQRLQYDERSSLTPGIATTQTPMVAITPIPVPPMFTGGNGGIQAAREQLTQMSAVCSEREQAKADLARLRAAHEEAQAQLAACARRADQWQAEVSVARAEAQAERDARQQARGDGQSLQDELRGARDKLAETLRVAEARWAAQVAMLRREQTDALDALRRLAALCGCADLPAPLQTPLRHPPASPGAPAPSPQSSGLPERVEGLCGLVGARWRTMGEERAATEATRDDAREQVRLARDMAEKERLAARELVRILTYEQHALWNFLPAETHAAAQAALEQQLQQLRAALAEAEGRASSFQRQLEETQRERGERSTQLKTHQMGQATLHRYMLAQSDHLRATLDGLGAILSSPATSRVGAASITPALSTPSGGGPGPAKSPISPREAVSPVQLVIGHGQGPVNENAPERYPAAGLAAAGGTPSPDQTMSQLGPVFTALQARCAVLADQIRELHASHEALVRRAATANDRAATAEGEAASLRAISTELEKVWPHLLYHQ